MYDHLTPSELKATSLTSREIEREVRHKRRVGFAPRAYRPANMRFDSANMPPKHLESAFAAIGDVFDL